MLGGSNRSSDGFRLPITYLMQHRALRGLALEASGDIGDACRTVAEQLTHAGEMGSPIPAVYLARGGRLRCEAQAGPWRARDGVPPSVGALGRAYRTGEEVLEIDGELAEACIPMRCAGDLAGVLQLTARRPITGPELERAREAAEALGQRIAELGGPPAELPTRRLLRHVARLSTLEDPAEIGRVVLAAALDVAQLDSAMLVRRDSLGHLEATAATGPLAEQLGDAPAPTLEAVSRWVGAGTSCHASGPGGWPTELLPLRASGVASFAAVGLFAQGTMHGMLVLAARRPVQLPTADAELLEILAAQAAASLRTAEDLRSLRLRAATDPLTGLGHHATFHEALAASHRRPNTAVLLCDVDGFKHLNDTYGHQHGDHVLRSVAAALTGALRRGDSLFRVGGDEFAALLVVSSEDEALEAGVRLRAAVLEAGTGVTVSIGVAVPRDAESDDSVLARADRALYRVKASGRDGVALAGDEPTTAQAPTADSPAA
jgi:diguanylate cyclase (GGDEF)-like protein